MNVLAVMLCRLSLMAVQSELVTVQLFLLFDQLEQTHFQVKLVFEHHPTVYLFSTPQLLLVLLQQLTVRLHQPALHLEQLFVQVVLVTAQP